LKLPVFFAHTVEELEKLSKAAPAAGNRESIEIRTNAIYMIAAGTGFRANELQICSVEKKLGPGP
jgi:hypothetical protein